VGSLAPGKRADMVVLRTAPGSPRDPWEAAVAARTEVATVVIDGAVALAGDRLAGIDAGDVETAAARARRRLW
jgi:cytosine/adenosine deaminase-related metal-dependent hydrolase